MSEREFACLNPLCLIAFLQKHNQAFDWRPSLGKESHLITSFRSRLVVVIEVRLFALVSAIQIKD